MNVHKFINTAALVGLLSFPASCAVDKAATEALGNYTVLGQPQTIESRINRIDYELGYKLAPKHIEQNPNLQGHKDQLLEERADLHCRLTDVVNSPAYQEAFDATSMYRGASVLAGAAQTGALGFIGIAILASCGKEEEN